jgi:hypothetical protein
MYCQRCGTYNEESFTYCTRCGSGLGSGKNSNTIIWVILVLLLGLPLLSMLISAILYFIVIGFG